MPVTSEAMPRLRISRRSVVTEGAKGVVVEKFDYPKEAVINHDEKTVNLAWYADRFKWNAVPDMSKCLDYYLATYCVAKELPLLSIQKWSLLFMNDYEHPKPRTGKFNDEEVLWVMDKICTTYLIIHPHKDEENHDENKNWSNTITEYIRKMLSSKKTKPVTMLLFMNLLGLRTAIVEPKQALAILGNIVPATISDEFNNEDEAKYGLVLPPDLLSNYTGTRWSSEDMQWIGNWKELTIGGENPEEMSSAFWRYTVAQLEKKKIRLKDMLVAQRNALNETSEHLALVRKEQREAEDLYNLANRRESLVPKHGTIKEKIDALIEIAQFKSLLFNSEIDDAMASAIFSEMRAELRVLNFLKDQPGPSSMVAPSRRQQHDYSSSSVKPQENEPTAVSPNGKRRKIITEQEVKSCSAEGILKEKGLETSGYKASTEPTLSVEVETVTEVFLNDGKVVVSAIPNNNDSGNEEGVVSKEREDCTVEGGVEDAREIDVLNGSFESSQKNEG